ncbi:MAG TPA: carboxypeptidase-like regulatory domain-containing protein [Blastocatellia bacterium]|nr:carboxypeptidase-like regulatory domain-containing protein [Blastocatellia bacterium]
MSKAGWLDRMQVISPCAAPWEQMNGNEQKRYCSECRKHVYDFSRMTRREVEALVINSGVSLCARTTRNPDGTLQTREAPAENTPDYYFITRRPSPLVIAAAAAALGLGAAGLTLPPLPALAAASAVTDQKSKKKDDRAHPGGAMAGLFGSVIDEAEAGIAGATLTLVSLKTGEVRRLVTDEDGFYRFSSLPPGAYSLKVVAGEYMRSEFAEIRLTTQAKRMDVTLRVPVMGKMGIPQIPLRALYRDSDLIVTARVGEVTEVEKKEFDRLLKINLLITSVLKGEVTDQVVDVYDHVYSRETGRFTPGDHLLLFLEECQPREGEKSRGGYEVSGWQSGFKRIPEEATAPWRDRIQELGAMMLADKPSAAEITEWLVRCIEDPATRWEGAADLLRSFETLRWDQEQQQRIEKECASGKCDQNDDPGSLSLRLLPGRRLGVKKGADRSRFAIALTAGQKERIAAALFRPDQISDADLPLAELVSHWDDPRFVPYFAKQLRAHEANPDGLAERLVEMIAARLGDRELSGLLEKYLKETGRFYEASQNQTEETADQDDTVEEEEAESDETTGQDEEETRSAEPDAEKEAEAAAARGKAVAAARRLMVSRALAIIENRLQHREADSPSTPAGK